MLVSLVTQKNTELQKTGHIIHKKKLVIIRDWGGNGRKEDQQEVVLLTHRLVLADLLKNHILGAHVGP